VVGESALEPLGLVGLKVVVRPMCLERGTHLFDDVTGIDFLETDIPLEPVVQRAARQVRGANEGGC
jgi:hypothetical protein